MSRKETEAPDRAPHPNGADQFGTALSNVLKSKTFRRAKRLQRLLEYVMEPGARLSERAVAAEVFGRSDFDPRTDTLVRVQFGRLRRRLEQYYQDEGKNDPERIELPARGYRPAISFTTPAGPANQQNGTHACDDGTTGSGPSRAGEPTRSGPHAASGAKNGEHHLIAVIPFANLTGEQEYEVFSQGLTEELINTLAGSSDVRVVSRTSAFQFKDESEDIRAIGTELGVDLILEGSVRREENRTRVIAELTCVADGFVIWSEAFDYDGDSILDGQATIAQAIEQALKPTLAAAA